MQDYSLIGNLSFRRAKLVVIKSDWLRSLAWVVRVRRLRSSEMVHSVRHPAGSGALRRVSFGQGRTRLVQEW